jgi:hypothetical protein
MPERNALGSSIGELLEIKKALVCLLKKARKKGYKIKNTKINIVDFSRIFCP